MADGDRTGLLAARAKTDAPLTNRLIEVKGAFMSKQETDKTKAEQISQINLADLPVDEARQEEVKGGDLSVSGLGIY